eukprot:TRINITY_DN1744_c0_g1_i1.p1 TRINITY_DN1744_c0_g1~~TRINITY_DN1744_c0_g1_i1.p1  ORF type:complete len:311 (+),score=12.15 TRINITY_DN1744_c0_g1_i1:311-1243(+)
MNCTNSTHCEQRQLIAFLIGLSGCVSLLGSLTIILSIYWFRLYGKLKNRLVLYLSIADVIQTISSISSFAWIGAPPTNSSFFCELQGFLLNYSNVTSTFWNATTCLYVTIFIVSTATYGTKGLPGKRFEIIALSNWFFGVPISGYGFTLVTQDKPFYYGPVSGGAYCWVTEDFPVERVTLHYLWMLVSLGVMILFTGINFFYLYCASGTFGRQIDKKIGGLMFALAGYPIIYGLMFLPLAVSRILSLYGVSVPLEVIWFGVVILFGNGAFNAIYYGITRKIFTKWRLEFSGTTSRGKGTKSRSREIHSKK